MHRDFESFALLNLLCQHLPLAAASVVLLMLARSIAFPPPLTIAEAFVATAVATDTVADDLADKEALDVWTLARSLKAPPAGIPLRLGGGFLRSPCLVGGVSHRHRFLQHSNSVKGSG